MHEENILLMLLTVTMVIGDDTHKIDVDVWELYDDDDNCAGSLRIGLRYMLRLSKLWSGDISKSQGTNVEDNALFSLTFP